MFHPLMPTSLISSIFGKEIRSIACAVSENERLKFLHYAGYA
jgi:hypothetical protein